VLFYGTHTLLSFSTDEILFVWKISDEENSESSAVENIVKMWKSNIESCRLSPTKPPVLVACDSLGSVFVLEIEGLPAEINLNAIQGFKTEAVVLSPQKVDYFSGVYKAMTDRGELPFYQMQGACYFSHGCSFPDVKAGYYQVVIKGATKNLSDASIQIVAYGSHEHSVKGTHVLPAFGKEDYVGPVMEQYGEGADDKFEEYGFIEKVKPTVVGLIKVIQETEVIVWCKNVDNWWKYGYVLGTIELQRVWSNDDAIKKTIQQQIAAAHAQPSGGDSEGGDYSFENDDEDDDDDNEGNSEDNEEENREEEDEGEGDAGDNENEGGDEENDDSEEENDDSDEENDDGEEESG